MSLLQSIINGVHDVAIFLLPERVAATMTAFEVSVPYESDKQGWQITWFCGFFDRIAIFYLVKSTIFPKVLLTR